MIIFKKQNTSKPIKKYKTFYDQALKKNQKNIEAISVSSYNLSNQEISSRFVNIKYVEKGNFIFFTNFESPKATDFLTHSQVSLNSFWQSTNVQIRIKGNIKKLDDGLSDNHFKKRSFEKNILAISSNQSKTIDSYNGVIKKYESTMESSKNIDIVRPKYWGGFEIIPYFYEFWIGHPNRLNERVIYMLKDNEWRDEILEP